ncbi:MAG: sulfurtransferase [Burkholderiaceae bacterium]
MLTLLKHCLQFLIATCVLFVQPLMAADGIRGNVVSVTWLQQNLDKADLLILDASPPPMYKAQHIPGAISVDVFTYGGQELSVPEMERRFQAWGINRGKKILIYDQGGSFMATRVFYDLYYYGFPAEGLLVLDGGMSKWLATAGLVTKDPTPAPQKGSFRITTVNEHARVKLPEFLAASGDPKSNALLEALDASWHFGETAFFDRAGHIPNGIMAPSADFFNADKTFKSADEIRRMVSYLGVKPEQQVYTYCGGGIAASVPFFALKFILDYPQVKLYEESELGWLQDERGLPFWTYDAPLLMRETNWLKAWNGKMLRMYGVSQVSLVDVRPAEVFKQGHLPFALNIPADVFKNHLKQPEKLAEILGQAGVNASHEAVVISDAGLNASSALAFFALERLGQKRVSVFTDSIDKWLEMGLEVTKEATAVGPRKGAGDLSIVPTTYATTALKNTAITDPKSTQGLFPKVFIASGKSVPAKTPDGKVVHVPYTDLLSADGKPKAAKDIWNILVKAGVPRYAELVSFSEDPGEAAANYFILKLMGYPDVKVLLP